MAMKFNSTQILPDENEEVLLRIKLWDNCNVYHIGEWNVTMNRFISYDDNTYKKEEVDGWMYTSELDIIPDREKK